MSCIFKYDCELLFGKMAYLNIYLYNEVGL